jgi:hypothetical protein
MEELSDTDPETHQLERSLAMPHTADQAGKNIRRLLVKSGTDVDKNDKDPYGDGDQTRLLGGHLEAQRRILLNLYSIGGDIEHYLTETSRLTPFSWNCVVGDRKAVEKTLEAAYLRRGPQALI